MRMPTLRVPSSDAFRGPWARAVGVTAAMFVVGYFVAATFLFPAVEDPTDGTFIEVPDLLDLAQEDARSRLAELGLEMAVATRINHPELTSEHVLAQSPLPGQASRPGDTVRVTLSTGPESRSVPELAGIAGPEAARLLRVMGFEVEIVQRRDAGGRAGVIETIPAAGTRLHVPAEVELVVSEGAAIVAVPALVGRHVDDVTTILEEAELKLGAIRYQVDAEEAPGRVVSQSPAVGSALRSAGFVSVVVAGTPPDSMAVDLAEDELPPSSADTLADPSGGR